MNTLTYQFGIYFLSFIHTRTDTHTQNRQGTMLLTTLQDFHECRRFSFHEFRADIADPNVR